jgi:hypothetical protein
LLIKVTAGKNNWLGKTSLKIYAFDIAIHHKTIFCSSVICVTWNLLGHPALQDSSELVQTIIVYGLGKPMFIPRFISPENHGRISIFAHQ